MNTRINKTLSVLAVIGIVASSFVWAMPVAASTPGDAKFTKQDIPSTTDNVLLPSSAINDIAVAADGKTIYVADGVDPFIFKSTDGGASFTSIKNNYSGTQPLKIAVAPDDVNTLAVFDGANNVIISRDGGTTWSVLSQPQLNGAIITGIGVAPARSGTLLGREYVVSLANAAAGNTAGGDVQIIGGDTSWKSVFQGSANITGNYDFTDVVVTPNFLGDRGVVAVGTANATGSTALFVINTATNTVVVSNGVKLAGSGSTTDFASPASGASITSASIALPSNFDPTTSAGRRAYVGFASGGNDQDVYRVDNDSVKALGAVTNAPVNSITYAGTVDSGTLFVGQKNTADVKYSKNMTAASPDWTTTLKGPMGDAATPMVVLAAASDFATSNKVYAGTKGTQAGFSVSSDAGVSFVQKALIAASNVVAPSLSFTGNTVFMATIDTGNYTSIWQSAVPFTTTSWSRIWGQQFASGAGVSVKLNPAYSTTPAIFVFETKVSNARIWVSQDGGVSFANRNAPTTGGIFGNAALRDAQTVYYLQKNGDIYKSTNAAWTWNTVVSTGLTSGANITLPKANQVIVSGNDVAISNDDAATFTSFTSVPGSSGTSSYSMATDAKYSDNNFLYVVDTGTGTNNTIYRIKTDNTGNSWEAFTNPGTDMKGLTQRSGVLYATTATGVVRTLNPADQIGSAQQNWKTLTQGLGTFDAGVTTTAGINIYARSGNTIYAYNDALATTKPTLTTPADNYAEPINPSTGFGNPIDLKWSPMGNGTGQVVTVDIEVADKANGLTGTVTTTTNISSSNPFYTLSGDQLFPNHSYLWRVRAAKTASDQVVDSPWSDARTINVQAGGIVNQPYAGIVLTGPAAGATNLDPNLVGFSWAPQAGATEYQIIIATDAALTKTVAGTPAKVTSTAYQATGLQPGTTYFWAVQATQPTVSQQSIGTFTTAPKSTGGTTGNQTGGTQQPPITVVVPPAQTPETPAYIWAVIAIGAILIIAVIILIVRTRRVP